MTNQLDTRPSKVDLLHPLDGGKVRADYTRFPKPLTAGSYLPTDPRTVRLAKKSDGEPT